MLIRAITCVFLALAITVTQADAQHDDWVRRYDCTRARGAVAIDGEGNEFAWQLAPDMGPFSRFNSVTYKGDDLTEQLKTAARLLWDDECLYLLIAVEDPDIWSSMTEGDLRCLCEEETIEVFIDPDGDGCDYAEIHVNCLETVNDIRIPAKPGTDGFVGPDGRPVDWDDLYRWNVAGLHAAVVNHGTVNDGRDRDRGTVFEIALPWAGLRGIAGAASLPPVPGDIWRINVNRYERPGRGGEDLSGWAPLERQSFHVPERFGFVRFVEE